MEIKNICCIGAGYVGGPTMAVIAYKCPDTIVNVVDINTERIKRWNGLLDKLPIYEPGLSEIIDKCRGKNLFFSNDIEEHIKKADMIFISVNTPTKKKGIGAGQASDLKWVESSARQVAKNAQGHTIVIEKSTLPVRTAEVIKSILKSAQDKKSLLNPKKTFDVLSNPEFLSEGSAIKDLLYPDRVLIGGENRESIKALENIYNKWVPEKKILTTNVWSSELAKLTSNAFLAQRVSSINAISALCEATGADVREVARAIGSDSRIGSKFLDSGPGFGGSCFKKDILNLVYLSEYFGLKEVADFWESVVDLNNWHQHRISALVVKNLFGTVNGKKIIILGFAFKANTNDTRESAAINICKDLLNEGAILYINDPKVSSIQIAKDLRKEENNELKKNYDSTNMNLEGEWCFVENSVESFTDSDAVIILTEWKEYFEIEWSKVSEVMRSPAWIFDSRSVISKEKVSNLKLNLWRIGDGIKD